MTYVDLTKAGGATFQEVRHLLGSKDDSQHRQLRVTSAGVAYLSDEVGTENISDLCFRFETWVAGNGYCGSKAAADDKYVVSVQTDLNDNWPTPKASYIDW